MIHNKIVALLSLFIAVYAHADTREVVKVANNTPTLISVWLSGYRTTQPVMVAPGQTNVLVAEEPAFICTEAEVTAKITLNVKVGNAIEQKTVVRNYPDGCGFSNDSIAFLIHQNSNKTITIDMVAVEKSVMLYQR